MEKNVAGKWVVYAFGSAGHASPGDPITGDAANITANIRIDGAAANAVDDTNPAELEDGYYIFDITAVESNGDNLVICPASVTANVTVVGVPGATWTRPKTFRDFFDIQETNTIDNALADATSTIFKTDLSLTGSDQIVGRSVIFKGDQTAGLKYAGGVITSFNNTGGEITINAPLPAVPADNDTFILI